MSSNGVGTAPVLAAVAACLLLVGLILVDGSRAASDTVVGLRAAPESASLHPASEDAAAKPVSSGVAHSRTWTRREMRLATPAGLTAPGRGDGIRPRSGASVSIGPVPSEAISDPSLPGFRTNGKLFFELGAGTDNKYSCSGTMVRSRRRNVVFTAGHCVFDVPTDDEPAQWSTNLVFVPGYSNGNLPFDQFPVADMVTTKGWMESQFHSFDLAVLSLQDPAQDIVGARRIEFGADPKGRSLEIFGYPAEPEPEFNGEKLIRCIPARTGFDVTQLDPFPLGATACGLRQGASGGGWILDGRYLVSVVSYSYCDESKDPPVCAPEIYGPQLGSAAVNLMNSATIGGTAAPSVRVVRRPPARVRKRAVSFRVTGDGDTPIRQFKVRLDRKPAVITGRTIRIRNLSPGRHTLWIRSMDQTRRLSPRALKRTFRVLPKKRKRTVKAPF